MSLWRKTRDSDSWSTRSSGLKPDQFYSGKYKQNIKPRVALPLLILTTSSLFAMDSSQKKTGLGFHSSSPTKHSASRGKPSRLVPKYCRTSTSNLQRIGLRATEIPSSLLSPQKTLKPSQPASANRALHRHHASSFTSKPSITSLSHVRSSTPRTKFLRVKSAALNQSLELQPSTTKKRLVSREIESGSSVVLQPAKRVPEEESSGEQSTEDDEVHASAILVKRCLAQEQQANKKESVSLIEPASFPSELKVKKFRGSKTVEDRADRFISSLCPDLAQRFSTKVQIYNYDNPLWADGADLENEGSAPSSPASTERPQPDQNLKVYTALLQNQLFGIKNPYVVGKQINVQDMIDGNQYYDENAGLPHTQLQDFSHSLPYSQYNVLNLRRSPLIPKSNDFYSLGPSLGFDAQDLLPPCKQQRKISKVPYKVLDAPALQDDFYLNLVDWSDRNSLAVGLGSCIYLWSASSSKVTKLYDLGGNDSVTAVSWSKRGTHLAVGTNSGVVQIWDTTKCKLVRTMLGHQSRVGALNWSEGTLLCSGSRDKQILYRDIRNMRNYLARLQGHKQEICGLKWSFDSQQLASGGNDNKLHLWSIHNFNHPVHKFSAHKAAVKALAWSPHQHGLLASGGGTADRCIRFWNTLTGTQLDCVETGSQVCNLLFSKNINELTSTHGYSQNQIVLWKYPEMKKTATLLGHTCRVLYLAISPDGQTIVTGAGDETLRFWNVYPKKKEAASSPSVILPSFTDLR